MEGIPSPNSSLLNSNAVKFTGQSLASACSNVIKNYLLVNMHNDEENQNAGMSNVSNVHDTEEDEDNSDICSLPECDSDLLEVNPDAPHIHSSASTTTTAKSYNHHQGNNLSEISLLQVSADDVDESIMRTIDQGALEDIINGVDAERVGVMMVDQPQVVDAGVIVKDISDTNVHEASKEAAVENVKNVNRTPRQENTPLEKLTAVGSTMTFTPSNVKGINKTATNPPVTLTGCKSSGQPPSKKICMSNDGAVPSTTPFLLMQKMLRGETDLHLPPDPKQWSAKEVSTFMKWLVDLLSAQQPLTSYDKFQIDGKLLFKIRKRNLQRLFAESAVDTLWMHVEALKFASVTALNNTTSASERSMDITMTTKTTLGNQRQQYGGSNNRSNMNAGPANRGKASTEYSSPGSGQIQLWQFLLELLTERNMSHIICWVGEEGAFKLVDPERVAQLWGERKNKPSMNYEKLSRALRYYYDGDLIHKVCGKRFVYQFVCDLKMLLGYSAAELSRLVNES